MYLSMHEDGKYISPQNIKFKTNPDSATYNTLKCKVVLIEV